MSRSEQGFSLLEMMVGVAVVGVLASVSIPGMINYQSRSMRTEAMLGLGAIQRMQNGYYEKNGAYASTIEELDYRMDFGMLASSNSWQGQVYAFTITPLDDDNQYYIATATGNLDGDVFQDILVLYGGP